MSARTHVAVVAVPAAREVEGVRQGVHRGKIGENGGVDHGGAKRGVEGVGVGGRDVLVAELPPVVQALHARPER